MSEFEFLQEEPPAYGGGGEPSPVLEYLRKLERALKRGDSTERTHRPALKELFEALNDKIIATNEPKRSECGAPDYVISRKRDQLSLGYVEAKDVGADLAEIERGEQLKRYLASLPTLLLTDYLEFRWFVDGKKRETFRLANVATGGKLTPASPDELERARAPLERVPLGPRRLEDRIDSAERDTEDDVEREEKEEAEPEDAGQCHTCPERVPFLGVTSHPR